MRSMVEGRRAQLAGYAGAPPPTFGWSPSPSKLGEDLPHPLASNRVTPPI